ncbi:MAG: hypothetical protein FJ139_00480 [Deltaproteobacteria bacterium]|nr:hypothetical protein [Deltaproteobacteria bacterium]
MKKLPDYREKQRILYIDKRPEAELITYGNAFLEEGKVSDALEFYTVANDITGLEKIRDIAESSGDVMLYQNALKALKRNPTEKDWNSIGEKAFALQKYSFALHAFEKSMNDPMIDTIRRAIKAQENGKTA